MTSKELQDRVNKAAETVEKKIATIERHKKQLVKKAQPLEGYIDFNRYNDYRYDTELRNRYKQETGRDLYWDLCDYSDKLSDIEGAENSLKEAKRILANWNTKLDAQLEKESTIEKVLPPIFKQLKADLTDEWTKHDLLRQEKFFEQRATLSYKELATIYSYSERELLSSTDEEGFRKANAKAAEIWIIDLYNRVKDIIGEVTDWSNIYYRGKALNGTVVGNNGVANVETITAGGYNIQRLHYRVLVHKIR